MPLYGIGSNVMGQLGLPDSVVATSTPTEIGFFKDKRVLKIACGKLHTLALCENNELYSWGVNDDHALGREGNEEVPELVKFKGTIAGISAGASHSAVLTEAGQVFACGTFKSVNGVLGFSPQVRYQPTFVRVGLLRGIAKIVSGANHILMLDRSGRLWAMGGNESGQLATTTRERHKQRSLEPTQISPNVSGKERLRFVDIGAGGFHSFAVKDDGSVLSWGSNINGQLGQGTFTPPTHVKGDVLFQGAAQVFCGRNHTLLLDSARGLYGCGDNAAHQLGISAGKVVGAALPILGDVTLVAAGDDHSIARVGTALYGWGFNLSGGAGAEETELKAPTEIRFDFGEVVDVACGTDFTMVLTK
ncbi:regulator of chromosome condensation [Pancytospora philotis]|nr:regulator of chromosome condensation [Pancytospora philotis]